MNGLSVSNGCSSIGNGNSIAPVPIPASVQSKLRFRYVGAKRHLHGVVIDLWTTSGTLQHLVLKLRRGSKVVETLKVSRVSTSEHKLVLRVEGQMPPPGRYTVTVTQRGKTILRRRVSVH